MSKNADYQQALDLGYKALAGQDPNLLVRHAGVRVEHQQAGQATLFLLFLNRWIKIAWPEFECADQVSGRPLPIPDKVLLVHYLNGALNAGGPPETHEWIAFQDLPEGRFYQAAFDKRAKTPLIKCFGPNPELLREVAARIYNADPIELGDYGVVIRVLPLVSMALVLWAGDAEFPPNGNILFDRNSVKLFRAEDVAWLAGRVIYPLINP
jgi:hypothetical protein